MRTKFNLHGSYISSFEKLRVKISQGIVVFLMLVTEHMM